MDSGAQLARLWPYFPPHLVQSVLDDVSSGCLGAPRLLPGTMLVADLKGFSAQSARLFQLNTPDNETLRTLVNNFFELALLESYRYGGSPFSFDGDALLIFFQGLDQADAAVTAALAIQQALSCTPVHLPGGDVWLQASFGLSSGPLLSASWGQAGGRVYTLLGEAATQAVYAQKVAQGPHLIAAELALSALKGKVTTRQILPGFYVIESAASQVKPEEPALVVKLNTSYAEAIVTFLADHFPPNLADRLLCGDPEPDDRLIATLFVNIDGLNEYVAVQDFSVNPELDRFFAGIRHIAEQHGGLLNKVNAYRIGHKYLILFGLSMLPCVEPKAAALQAAVELQAWAGNMAFPLRQRIGLSVGRANEGLVGVPWRREFTVIGRPVNEAVHLMELAAWGEIMALGDFSPKAPLAGWIAHTHQVLLKGYNQRSQIYRFSPI